MKSLKDHYKVTKFVAIDTETSGDIKKHSVWHPSINMAYMSYAYYEGDEIQSGVLSSDDHEEVIPLLEKWLYDDAYTPVFWNANFDIPILLKFLKIHNKNRPLKKPVADGLLLAQILYPTYIKHDLKTMGRIHFGSEYPLDSWEKELKAYMKQHKIKDYSLIPRSVISKYAKTDAIVTLRAFCKQLEDLDKKDCWETWKLEASVQPYVIQMCATGVYIDKKEVTSQVNDAVKELEGAKKTIDDALIEATGKTINLNSPKQLAECILTLDPEYENVSKRTKAGAISTDEESLERCSSPIIDNIVGYRSIAKSVGTYYSALTERPVHNRLHCNLNQGAAITGRFSSSGPNLQNQPRGGDGPLGKIRKCYSAPKGKRLLMIDFDQIEFRLACLLARDYDALDAIRNGEDMHSRTTKKVFNVNEDHPKWKLLRYVGKTLNFATLYGAGKDKVATIIRRGSGGKIVWTPEKAGEALSRWWETYPAIATYRNSLETETALYGQVRTIYGRLIPCDSMHKALNYMIQGSAADIMKGAILKVGKMLKMWYPKSEVKMLLTVHDELMFEVADHKNINSVAYNIIQYMMPWTTTDENNPILLTCSAKQGKNWLETEDVIPHPISPFNLSQ